MGFQKLTETSVGPETSAQLVVLLLVALLERLVQRPEAGVGRLDRRRRGGAGELGALIHHHLRLLSDVQERAALEQPEAVGAEEQREGGHQGQHRRDPQGALRDREFHALDVPTLVLMAPHPLLHRLSILTTNVKAAGWVVKTRVGGGRDRGG